MKLLVIGDEKRVEKYLPSMDIVEQVEIIVAPRGVADEELLELAVDADFIMADAISPVSERLISAMPNLKLIHSEGVAFNRIDCAAAAQRGVPVCNNAGVNAGAVAEQAIMLMLGCLRDVIAGDDAVRAGRQIQKKERMMVEGFRELGDCKVGFVGFGAIGQATAERLSGWGCEMVYNKRTPLSPEEEARLGVSYSSLDELLASCDIVSLHVPVTAETIGLVNAEFIAKMKKGSVLINTARGEIVDQPALKEAIVSGHIAAAGLDTLHPEPVRTDNPLLHMPAELESRIVFSPHIGGVSEGMFYRAHRTVWQNIERVVEGKQPVNKVN